MRTWPAIDVGRLSAPELLQAALVDYALAAIDERTPVTWRLFFESPAERDRAATGLSADFPDLSLESIDIPDDDWAARSQADLRAIRVGQIIVAPPWDVPDPGDLQHRKTSTGAERASLVVIIQPSLGFGTGHHATTRLCLAALQQHRLEGSTVLDVGTGSGVLAIAASLLGAGRVIAIDNDPDAVQSAQENAVRNRAAIDLGVADLRAIALSRFDLVLANLTGALLVESAARLQELTTRRGQLILSGFMGDEEAGVVAAFPRLRTVDRSQEDEWVCLTLQHESGFQ